MDNPQNFADISKLETRDKIEIISAISHLADFVVGTIHDLYEKKKAIDAEMLELYEKAILVVFKVTIDALIDEKISSLDEALRYFQKEVKESGIPLDMNFMVKEEG